MTIPKSIYEEHIIKAIEKIDREGVPKRRESTRFFLSYNGKYYPPKYVISIANLFANDEEYLPSRFSGGEETNEFLKALGFKIMETVLKTNEALIAVIDSLNIPALEPGDRVREYNLYEGFIRDRVVYEYLFNSQSHRWIDNYVIGLKPNESKGYQAMNILHFIGLRDIHKGIFKDFNILEVIQELEKRDSDFSLVIESLQRYENKDYFGSEILLESTKGEAIELESTVKEVSEQIEVTETEKEQIIKSRIGQSAFKKALLNVEKRCRLCAVTHAKFLVASHIKPWSQSNHQERLDVNNGLLLCPNHDSLFDKGYISFDELGEIIISNSLDEQERLHLRVSKTMKIALKKKQKEYMKWHYNEYFGKN